MRRIATSLAALCVIGVLAAPLVPTKSVNAQSVTPVAVVNTPLPIKGTVKVADPVTLASGTTVNVGNAADNPVLVRDVSKNQPAHGFNGCFFKAATCLIDLVTVPAGQRLVIEHISGNIQTQNGQTIVFAQIGQAYSDCCIVTNDDYLVTQPVPQAPIFQVNHQTLMFFSQGQTVRVYIAKSVADSIGVANFSYAGYYLPL